MTRVRTYDKVLAGLGSWESYQQDEIREGAGDAGAALYQAERALETAAELRAVVLAQREQIEELGVFVRVLANLLSQSGAVDPSVLRHRVEAELESVAEAKAAARAAAVAPTGPTVKCVRCDRIVPSRATQLTTEGVTCDSCLASGI